MFLMSWTDSKGKTIRKTIATWDEVKSHPMFSIADVCMVTNLGLNSKGGTVYALVM